MYDFLLPGCAENSSVFREPTQSKGRVEHRCRHGSEGVPPRRCPWGPRGKRGWAEGHSRPAPAPLAAPQPMAGALRGVDATWGGLQRSGGNPSSLLPTCPPPRSSTWGPSIQFLGGTWWSFSEGSHHVCFLRGL